MKRLDSVLKLEFIYVLLMAIALFVYAFFSKGVLGEAYIGSFEVNELNEGWTLANPDGEIKRDVKLPITVDGEAGKSYTLTNTLPDDVCDGARVCIRATRQNIRILVNDQDRGLYRSVNFNGTREAAVSGNAIADLRDGDAGKSIKIVVTAIRSESQRISEVTYGYGNNVWFPYIKSNMVTIIVACFLVVGGLITIIAYFIIRKKIETADAIAYLALVMFVDGLWIISESPIRQIIFNAPSYTSIFAFLLVESMAAFGAMYFNAVQEHRYEKIYVTLETILLVQLFINTILHFTGVVDYFDTLIFSHIWSGITILAGIVCLAIDIKNGYVRRYAVISFGMLVLLVSGAFELVVFYAGTMKLGAFLGLGLMTLLGTTAIQTIKNAIARVEERRIVSEKMNEATFKTIASTIDAKDEYTGGHSERVGEYARKIAIRMADEYNFTEEDFNRIHYIGLMHDIGKIGVPDGVLNKNGRLDDEEFALMKQHTVIGDDILKNLGSVPGLKDGVRHHHERYDGKGYPDGLKEKEISPYARILCIADSFDAMTSDRIYRKKLTREQVINEIEKNRGAQFAPEVADAVLEMIKEGII